MNGMEGRRHSVDVPISRTLIALRRVRSLRDPSTNSMSKLTSLVDNLDWETNSNNAMSLGFEDNSHRVKDNVIGQRSLTLVGKELQHVSDHELYYGSSRCKSRLVEMVCDDKALSERYCSIYGEKDLEFACETPSGDCIIGGGSSNEPNEILRQVEKRHIGGSKAKIRQRKVDSLSRVIAGDVLSCAGSPCLSVGDSRKDQLSNGMSLYRNEDFGFMESCHQGCGIGSCWTRSRKLKGSNLLPDVEEQPLLFESAGVSQFEESSRSLCQKYMPKSFSELVGQNTVSTSLLNAISKRQIVSLYLFHGPRGTGKTSASRIFSAALNCLSPETSRPCGLCQECVLFFSGRSRDVKEVDSVRINKMERCRSLIKNARIPSVYSRFKIYIIDECHLLQRETWANILNSLEELPRHVVFIMVTPNLDKLPRSAVSKSQRFQFQKVREDDIAGKLGRICVQEGFDFEQDALNFIATKSNGSLRNAEMMLDQLSLLGKKITTSLIYEVNGVVSDDELLDLLYLALSSDASNTVKRARELVQSRIDPLQLISQLASLIMDILAGKCPDRASEKRQKLFGNNSEADMQQLSHALKILSQAEKQLRTSNNQTTWLTVALLQLSSAGSSHDVSGARLSMRSLHSQDGDVLSTSSTSESLKRHVACGCVNAESGKMGMQFGTKGLELVWIRATQMCTSTSLKKFLLKRGKLVSVRLIHAGIAVAELEFDHPDYVFKAEKSWKVIAGALQHMLGYNVELRINLAHSDSNKHANLKKPRFSLFNCSRKVHLRSAESQSNASENSDSTPTTVITRDKYVETFSSECGSQISCTCCHGKELFKAIRSNDGNALSIEVGASSGGPDTVHFRPESKTGSKEHSRFRCWRIAMFPFQKAWQLRHHQRGERLVDYGLHCAVAK